MVKRNLLLLYTGTLAVMMYMIVISDEPGHKVDFHGNITFIVNNVGGLISAIVIAKLAITQKGENPLLVTRSTDNKLSPSGTVLAFFYAIIWVLTGLSCLVIGEMLYPSANKTISDIGATWFGVSVAASNRKLDFTPSVNCSMSMLNDTRFQPFSPIMMLDCRILKQIRPVKHGSSLNRNKTMPARYTCPIRSVAYSPDLYLRDIIFPGNVVCSRLAD